MAAAKHTILILAGVYLPGYLGGGPIRSIANLVEALGDELHFRIITRDRDIGSREPYPGITADVWRKVGKAEVFYVSPKNVSWLFLRRLINSTSHQVLYLNSFFSPGFAILPLLMRRLGLIARKDTVIAPRGEFSKGALRLKPFRKKIYIRLARLIGLCRHVVWHASSPHEDRDIKAIYKRARVAVASNLHAIRSETRDPEATERYEELKEKKPGTLKAVFLSRISPKKNLDGALRMLKGLSGEISFCIYGPIEDRHYWGTCQRIIDTLPSNIHVHYKGPVAHDEVANVLSDHDLFFFPTQGENFGHVILEALLAGCPVLISDQTPWRDLEEKGVGWDLPLDEQSMFAAVLQRCVTMRSEDYRALSRRAREYGIEMALDPHVIHDNRELFSSTRR